MAFALVANVGVGSSSGNGATTAAINTTGANLIVLVVADYDLSGDSSVSDSKGNTWTPLTSYAYSPVTQTRIHYCLNPTVGTGHTFTVTLSGGYPSLLVQAWSGAHASSSFDAQNGAAVSGAASELSTGSVTPSVNDELIVAGICLNVQNVAAIDNGMTISDNIAYGAGAHFAGAMAYKVQTTAAAINPKWTWSPGDVAAASIATFKATVGGSILRQMLQHAH